MITNEASEVMGEGACDPQRQAPQLSGRSLLKSATIQEVENGFILVLNLPHSVVDQRQETFVFEGLESMLTELAERLSFVPAAPDS